ncbi:MAG: hypothetical protein ILA24_00005 [Ruminococcus sp.]|nr:hypothetical protein [Ruminococcus sp.]
MYGNDNEQYKMCGYNLKVQRWYCPNCSALLEGYEDSSGRTRIKCPRCGTVMTKYRQSRQFDILELRVPESCFN